MRRVRHEPGRNRSFGWVDRPEVVAQQSHFVFRCHERSATQERSGAEASTQSILLLITFRCKCPVTTHILDKPSSQAKGRCAELLYPWLNVSANHGSELSRTIKCYQLTTPGATANMTAHPRRPSTAAT